MGRAKKDLLSRYAGVLGDLFDAQLRLSTVEADLRYLSQLPFSVDMVEEYVEELVSEISNTLSSARNQMVRSTGTTRLPSETSSVGSA